MKAYMGSMSLEIPKGGRYPARFLYIPERILVELAIGREESMVETDKGALASLDYLREETGTKEVELTEEQILTVRDMERYLTVIEDMEGQLGSKVTELFQKLPPE